MSTFTVADLQAVRIQSIADCLVAFGLDPKTNYHPDLLNLDILPTKPSKKLAILILTYKQECTVDLLKTISDQPAGIVKALRNQGFVFKSHPSFPKMFQFQNSKGELCREILYFTSPRLEPKGRAKELLEKSLAACISAIEIYNKPDFRYREETFAILMINAWELMLKAKILTDNKNDFRSIVAHDNLGNPKKGRSGNFLTIELMGAITKLIGKNSLDPKCRNNIELLVEIRDNAIHYVNNNLNLQRKVMEIGTASLQNYLSAAREWFNKDLSRYNFYLMPLSFFPATEIKEHTISSDADLSNLLRFIYETEQQYPSSIESNYNVTLSYEVKIRRATDPNYTLFVSAPSEDGIPITMHEEDIIKTKYPWPYPTLLGKLRSRYINFKQDKKFYDIKRELEENSDKFSKLRYLNSLQQKGPKQRFYSPEIIKEFDKHYIKC